jgi:hypothetical protein
MKLFKKKKNVESLPGLEDMAEKYNCLLFRRELLHSKQVDEAERLEKQRKVGREYTI